MMFPNVIYLRLKRYISAIIYFAVKKYNAKSLNVPSTFCYPKIQQWQITLFAVNIWETAEYILAWDNYKLYLPIAIYTIYIIYNLKTNNMLNKNFLLYIAFTSSFVSLQWWWYSMITNLKDISSKSFNKLLIKIHHLIIELL